MSSSTFFASRGRGEHRREHGGELALRKEEIILRDRIPLDGVAVLGLSARIHGFAAPTDGAVLFVYGVAPSSASASTWC